MTDQDAAALRRLIGVYGLDHVLTELLRATAGWPKRYGPVRKYLKAAFFRSLGSCEMKDVSKKSLPKQDTNNPNNCNNGKMRSKIVSVSH